MMPTSSITSSNYTNTLNPHNERWQQFLDSNSHTHNEEITKDARAYLEDADIDDQIYLRSN